MSRQARQVDPHMERESVVVVPDACTLPTAEQPTRVADLETVFSSALRSRRMSSTRLDVVLAAEPAGARELLRREAECCSFFTFTWSSDSGGEPLVTVEVPSSQVSVLDAIEDVARRAASS